MIRARQGVQWLLIGLLALFAASGAAPPDDALPLVQHEDLSKWEWYHDVKLPKAAKSGLTDLIVPPSVFGRSRVDLGDLRLIDAGDKPIPYALRIRTPRNEQAPLPIQRAFNRVTNPDRSVEISIDLGEAPPQHNEIVVNLPGQEYGRPLRLDGSADNKTWSKILDGVYVVHLPRAGETIDDRRFSYPPSRLRYLRIHVRPDRVIENDHPKIESVQVFHTVNVPGETVTLPAKLEPREPVRLNDQYASAWVIDLGEENVPVEKLSLEVDEPEFSRPYRLELFDPSAADQQQIMNGQLQRRPGQRASSVEIDLRQGFTAHWLRLTVEDDRNLPVTISQVRFTAAAPQVVFAVPAGLKTPLRLYYGNPNASALHYDFAASLPLRLDPPPARAELSGVEKNPAYVPPPIPWTERWPYLVDLVLAAACAVLLGILVVLARSAIRKQDAAPTT